MTGPKDISPAEFEDVLESHQKWIETGGTEGHMADLSGRNLGAANLRDVCLQNANLFEADLSQTTGLLERQLGGADLCRARLPKNLGLFHGVEHAAAECRNVKKLFMGMILACAYSGLTIVSAEDVRLLTNSTSSPLPLIGTTIPVVSFFYLGPLILISVYLYFHLCLQRMWESLAALPAIFPDGSPLDKRAEPWLLTGLIRSHLFHLKKYRLPMSRVQTSVSLLLGWWTVPITVALFWLWYLRRHDWFGTRIHITCLVGCFMLACWFQRHAKVTLQGMPPLQSSVKLMVVVLSLTFVGFYIVSVGAINGIAGWSMWMARKGELSQPICPSRDNTPYSKGEYEQLRLIVPKVLEYIGLRAFTDVSRTSSIFDWLRQFFS